MKNLNHFLQNSSILMQITTFPSAEKKCAETYQTHSFEHKNSTKQYKTVQKQHKNSTKTVQKQHKTAQNSRKRAYKQQKNSTKTAEKQRKNARGTCCSCTTGRCGRLRSPRDLSQESPWKSCCAVDCLCSYRGLRCASCRACPPT